MIQDPIVDLSSELHSWPDALRPRAVAAWEAYAAGATDMSVLSDPALRAQALKVWTASDFVAHWCARQPERFAELVNSGDLTASYAEGTYTERLRPRIEGAPNDQALARELRLFRQREMVRIAWRDLSGAARLAETVRDLSALADACIDGALQRLYEWHCQQWGTPVSFTGEPQQLVVLGMGKLGARELNFSSDVDLIFAYAEDGETRDGRRTIANQEFFIRLGQRLITVLDQKTADGFVFRVDMRLRPFGESSPLVASFGAIENYYQVHGREWERYAMIKARVVAGDRAAGKALLTMLRPFVYRRYVDFGAFESLREMKAMIEQEVRRKGLESNVKLGAGGIREVEFIGQAFQLIRGGREPALRQRPILPVLDALVERDLLPPFVVDELKAAYVFLRDTEHRLQMFADRQTHALPETEEDRLRLAWSMGFPDWSRFERALRQQMARVHQHFDQVFAAPQRDHAESDELDLLGVWRGTLDRERALAVLRQAGFQAPEAAVDLLERTREGHACRALSAQGRQRLDRLMPLLIGAVAACGDADGTLPHLLRLIEAIRRRSSYFALLVENPMALSQLVRLCAASVWIANLLARHPLLLDELLDARSLYHPPMRSELERELRQQLSRVSRDDMEQQMEVLRQFQQANTLRVAAAEVTEAVPLMVASDQLTELAEVVIDEGLELAWHHLVQRHGRPACGEDLACDKGFAVIGYGKLGGIELGYGSDLDLVFLHSDESEGRVTDGDKPVDNAVFFARLAQRLIHVLNTRTPAGIAYEVDTRLRPSGASGLLVSGLSAFADYQATQAWTWEHQALVRARPVAGDPAIGEAFWAVRRTILGQPRDREALRQAVREMREKMRSALSRAGADAFDLKQDCGGIADIEFMVQYGVLAWAHDYPDLLDFTDNIRLLDGLARNGILVPADAGRLADAYRAYRSRVHRLALREEPAVVTGEFAEHRETVIRIWRELMER